MDNVSIMFDEESRVRVLDADHFRKTQALQTECTEFVGKIQTFSDTVKQLVEVLSQQAEVIEREKLKAIGQRNLVDYERDNRRRKMATLRAHIAEKRAELERARAQLSALERVEADQREMIDKMMAA